MTTTNGIAISKGWTVRGQYMGVPFSGKVDRIEADALGYKGTQNDWRICITLDGPAYIRVAGDGIIMHAVAVGGGKCVRSDSRYENVIIRKAA